MTSAILAVDFGSTLTKVTAVSAQKPVILGTAKAFTTFGTDIREGLFAATAELEKQIGKCEYTHKLAASSAGGGLKMVAVGLVPTLTAKAAETAACSAGAKVVKTYAYELTAAEQAEIAEIAPDLILLSGGTDGGNKEVLLHNAKMLAGVQGEENGFAVIIAGNKSAAEEARTALTAGGKHAVICANVMPVFNTLDVAPAKAAIHTLFLEKIIEAKGLAEAGKIFSAPIIPTPLAVFEATQLLAESLGDVLAVDVGGATTDVYSMCAGTPTLPGVALKGLPEPYAKRSVEGDLGLRHSQEALIEALLEALIEAPPKARPAGTATIPPDALEAYRAACTADYTYVPAPNHPHAAIDAALCGLAVDMAVTRHAGFLETAYSPFGESFYQQGKDLSAVKYVIGIGGALIHSLSPEAILAHAAQPVRGKTLKPTSPKYLVDKKYIFGAMGLLSRVDKKRALQILESEL